ncbi:MAG TPA: hypothetical protein VK968_17800, partial [Roseimicrobium sp.]|nr:hypothetical protein [Roseimicrobium sp.]
MTITTDPDTKVTSLTLRGLKPLAIGTIALLLFGLGIILYTRNNDFPMRYHPDESGKVDQILSADQRRNYHHPQLLLEVTDKLLALRPTTDPQAAVQVGRTTSAIFAALTVVAGAVLGYFAGRLRGMLLIGAVLLFSPPMVIYSHYMKEDAGLMLGLVLCLLASRVFWGKAIPRRRDLATDERLIIRPWWRDLLAVAFMGVACAVAISGKYVGVYALAALLPLLFFPRGRGWLIPLRPLVFLIFAAGAVLLINHLIFKDWDGFVQSLQAETHHGLTEHFDLAMDVPTGYFIRNTWETATLPVKVLAALYLPLLLITWKRRSGWDVFPIVFLAVSTAVISRCPIPFPRYGLPMVITVYVMAGLAGCFAIDLADLLAARFARSPESPELSRGNRKASLAGSVLAAAVMAFVLIVQIPLGLDYVNQFAHDSRQGLRDWLIQHGQPGASIAADFYAGLRDDGRPNHTSDGWEGFSVAPEWYGFAPQAAGWGNLRNFRYIAICDIAYERYSVPEAHGYGDRGEEFELRKNFYRTLIDRCTPVWKSVPTNPMHAYTNPAIYLYDTRKLPKNVR